MRPHTLLLASVIGLANTQSIDPSSVPIGTRDQWCINQENACPLICLQLPGTSGSPTSNTCDPTTLDYSCVCSNGQSPNASEYTQTIPYYICTTANQQCVTNCNGITSCQSACVQDHPCGAQTPVRANKTSTVSSGSTATSSSVATGTGATVVYTGFGSSATAATNSSGTGSGVGHAMMLEMGQVYGTFALIGGILGGFFVLL